MSPDIQAVYVHVPFCRTLCGYCDFYSVVAEPGDGAPVVDALLRELDRGCSRHAIAPKTLFVGGGTPTVLPLQDLHRLLVKLRELAPRRSLNAGWRRRPPRVDLGRDARATLRMRGDRALPHAVADLEFTVEANPATVTPEIADVLVSAGVNRVSIGAQSFDPAELRVLERTHEPSQVAETVATCRRAGLERISLDLIFAIPGQTLESWSASLAEALTLEPEHLSCYALTFEPGTRLFDQLEAGEIERVDEDLDVDMYEYAIDTLAAAGYEHYEISNFALPGRRCRHNLTYWRNEAYLGVGPSAAGFLDGVRYKNIADVGEYVRRILANETPRAEEERRTADQRARESAMLELRMIEGIDRRRFSERFGRDPADFFAEAVGRYRERKLLNVSENHVRLTRAGLLLADTVIADFL